MRSVLASAYEHERTMPERPYLTQPMGGGVVKEWTWRQALGEARRMAAYLRGLGLPAGSHIAILSKNSAHWILADLAIWMAGHVTVPIYPVMSATGIGTILVHSEARLVFVGKLDDWESQALGVPAGLPVVTLPLGPAAESGRAGGEWEALVAAHAPIADDPLRRRDEVATIVYTSGSTGEPKGAMISFGAIDDALASLTSAIAVRRDDRMLSHLPLAHVAERWVVECMSLYVGYQVFFSEDLKTFAADLKRARPTLFFTVPRLWQKFQQGVLAKMPAAKLSRLLRIPIVSRFVARKILRGLGLDAVRVAVCGAAPMPASLSAWYRRLGIEMLDNYGMTENFACSHGTRPGRVRAGYVGEPYPGVVCRIADDGEIQIRSPGQMIGYYKAPQLTAEAFTADGFLRTGDRGEIDERGRLRITGRVKELFKTSKGKYVAPAPIESKLVSHPGVEAACVGGLGRPQPYGLVMLDAATQARALAGTGNGERAQLEAALKEHLCALNRGLEPHEELAFVAVVRDQWQVSNGFLTPTLKIKRAVIEKTYEGELDRWYAAKRSVVWQG
jgi:long-subunit acyl-CoA synthetase (AMP-forming)